MGPKEIVAEALVPGTSTVLVLGSFESRVTVYAQQVRALNLIDALISESVLRKDGRVAIVGGGAAGITAAVALAKSTPGLQALHLFETRSDVLQLQRNSGRYLHPHFYDWPAVGSNIESALLPIMNWTASSAGEVAETLMAEFEATRRSSILQFFPDTKVAGLKPTASTSTVQVLGPDLGSSLGRYDIVILAIGFGLEAHLDGETRSYWSPSDLAAPIHTHLSDPLIFISGNGDGGLVDFQMAAFNALEHRQICELVMGLDLGLARAELEAIEREAWSPNSNLDLLTAYRSRLKPQIPGPVWQTIIERLRPNVRILFHTKEAALLRRTTALHNRLATFLILEAAADNANNIEVLTGVAFIDDDVPQTGPVRLVGREPFEPFRRLLRLGANTLANLAPFDELLSAFPGRYRPPASALRPASPRLSHGAATRFSAIAASEGVAKPTTKPLQRTTPPNGSLVVETARRGAGEHQFPTLTDVGASLAGNHLAVIVGDVLGDETGMSRAQFYEGMRAWRRSYRERHHPVVEANLRTAEQEHAVLLLNQGNRSGANIYEALARLEPSTIISLFPDPMLERTFSRYRPRTTDKDLITFDLGPGHKDLFLLGGSATLGVSLLISDLDHGLLAQRLKVLGLGFRDKLSMCEILGIGLDESQFATQRLLQTMLSHRTSRDGRITFARSRVSQRFLDTWNAREVGGPLLDALLEMGKARHLHTFKGGVQDASAPSKPFKYLDYYTPKDAAVFKGREEDTERIVREIKASAGRVVVLTGRSGTGKTSIVRAAVTPALEHQLGCVVVYARCGAVPEASIIDACQKRLDAPEAIEAFVPDHFASRLHDLLAQENRPCVVILDQAEEAFITLGVEVMQRFVNNIEGVLRRKDISVRVMFVIRSDYLSEMFAINSAAFPVLEAPVFLDDFTWDQARRAIVDPMKHFGVDLEEGLADLIMGDLDPDRILPAHLSIVCDRIFTEFGDQAAITLERFRRSKLSTQAIIVDHLERSLAGIADEDREAVEKILMALVTGDGTRQLMSAKQIAQETGLSERYVNDKAHLLIHQCRLLREVVHDPVRYELSHETLATELRSRMEGAQLRLREMQDMLRREVAASQYEFGRLISPERLEVIDGLRDTLVLDADSLTLIVASYAQAAEVPAFWSNAAHKLQERHIVEAALLRPIAAGCAHLKGVLKGTSRNVVKLRPFGLGELTPQARKLLIDHIDQGDPASLEMLAPFLKELDDGLVCLTILKLCAGWLSEDGSAVPPKWMRKLIADTGIGLVGAKFEKSVLDELLLDLYQILLTFSPRDEKSLDLSLLQTWVLSGLEDSPAALAGVVEKIVSNPNVPLQGIDERILKRTKPVEQIVQRLQASPRASFNRLAPLLFTWAPDHVVRISISVAEQLDVSQCKMLVGWLREVRSNPLYRESVKVWLDNANPSAQLLFVLATLNGYQTKAVVGASNPWITFLDDKLLALSDLMNSELRQFGWGDDADPLGRTLPAGHWLREHLDPRWGIFDLYAKAAKLESSARSLPESVWRAGCRLCILLGQTTGLPPEGLARRVMALNSDYDDLILLLRQSYQGARSSDRAALASLRQDILRRLCEHNAPTATKRATDLARIVEVADEPAERLGAALTLQRYNSALLTQDHSRLIVMTRGLRGLSKAQLSLLQDLADAFVPRWDSHSVFKLYASSEPIITRLAGRFLAPRWGIFQGREKLLRQAIMAVRSRPPQYRTSWLELAREGSDEPLPAPFVEVALQEHHPTKAELKAVGVALS
ncbi:MAG: ATP-binding protein [Alphaproteobacteria bacterium]|nr:MAG: ATP-binding protein [Alphaproteobacteria bacterium]